MLSTTAKIAAAATAGYVLGRNKRLRLTIVTTCLIAGKDLAEDAKLISTRLVDRNPELEELRTHLAEDLPVAARDLAMAAAASGIEAASSGTESVTESLEDAKRAVAH